MPSPEGREIIETDRSDFSLPILFLSPMRPVHFGLITVNVGPPKDVNAFLIVCDKTFYQLDLGRFLVVTPTNLECELRWQP